MADRWLQLTARRLLSIAVFLAVIYIGTAIHPTTHHAHHPHSMLSLRFLCDGQNTVSNC